MDITVLKDQSIQMKKIVLKEIIVLKGQAAQSNVPQVRTDQIPLVEPFPPASHVRPANTAPTRVSFIPPVAAKLDITVRGDKCLPLQRTTYALPVTIVPGHALNPYPVPLEHLVKRELPKQHLAPRVHTSLLLVQPHA